MISSLGTLGIRRTSELLLPGLKAGVEVALVVLPEWQVAPEDEVPAWWNNRLKRLVQTPKRYVVDPSVATAVLQVDRQGLRRDADLLGRVQDTFVASQLRAEARLGESDPTLYHLRTGDQLHEVDLLAEYPDGTVFAFEIKSSSAVAAKDARHLAWLRDELGDRFIGGAVLHTGPRSFALSDRITAAPISALWSRPAETRA